MLAIILQVDTFASKTNHGHKFLQSIAVIKLSQIMSLQAHIKWVAALSVVIRSIRASVNHWTLAMCIRYHMIRMRTSSTVDFWWRTFRGQISRAKTSSELNLNEFAVKMWIQRSSRIFCSKLQDFFLVLPINTPPHGSQWNYWSAKLFLALVNAMV